MTPDNLTPICPGCRFEQRTDYLASQLRATVPHLPGCEHHPQKDARPIGAISLERGRVLGTFDEDTMLALTPAERHQATLSLHVLLLHLERTGFHARTRPCPT